jgi:Right handed beta helix region
MTKTAVFLALIIAALASIPAHAQQRVFVSGAGLDTNPCTVTQPCRTFQQAHDTAAANGESDVLDPAGYGPLTITKGISIQAHGFGGITMTTSGFPSAAITISVTTGDPVTLNGLLIDGAGTGLYGIYIISGRSVQILNSVVRHFQSVGIFDNTSTTAANLLIEDTIASDNSGSGITVNPAGANAQATLNRITANDNILGVAAANINMTISNSVLSNNSNSGLRIDGGTTWLAKTVISGNGFGVNVLAGTVNSYGDNYIRNNGTPVSGSLTPVTTQ